MAQLPKFQPTTKPASSSPNPPTDPACSGIAAVALRLDVSTRHVRRLITAGDLPVHRIGRTVRVAEEDLERLLRHARQ